MGISAIDGLPDISYIDNLTLEQVTGIFLDEYMKNLKEITGEEVKIDRCDPYRLLILCQSVINAQMLFYIDHCGKMNSLKYAHGAYLDHLGAFKNRPRGGEKPAKVIVRFSLSAVRDAVEPIPIGTMVTADQKVFFETDQYGQIPAGELSADVPCICTEMGTVGNEYGVGEINTLVTPVGFISSVMNTTSSAGGEDVEGDEEYREGIYNAPNKYSTAGPDDAWVAKVKDYHSDVEDVKPTTVPGSGVITIHILMRHGRLPDEGELTDVLSYLSRSDVRTFGIRIDVKPPAKAEYGIDLTYYIAQSDRERVSDICREVDAAVVRYIEWQGNKIGRDINPDELLSLVKQAGAKRAVITSPVFSPVPENAVAYFNGVMTANFGGVESD